MSRTAVRQVRDWLFTLMSIRGNAPRCGDTQGMCSKLELPTLKFDFDTNKRAGNYSPVSYPLSPAPLELKATFLGMSLELQFALQRSIGTELIGLFTGVAEDVTSFSETTNAIPYRVFVRGPLSEFSLGNMSAQENGEFSFSMMCNYLRKDVGSDPTSDTYDLFVYDPRNWNISVWSPTSRAPINILESRVRALGLNAINCSDANTIAASVNTLFPGTNPSIRPPLT